MSVVFVSAGERVDGRRLSGPFAEACRPLDPADVSGWQLCLSAGFGAGSHHPNHPVFLRETMAEFCTLADWPPYSPDLNPLDFSVWSVLQEKVQATPHTSFAALCWSITRQWNRMLPAYVCRICRSFRCCLETAMAKNGSYIE